MAIDASDALSLAFAKKKKAFAPPVPLAPIADTHAHLLSFWGKDPVEVLARAALSGVRSVTTIYDPIADAKIGDASAYGAWLRGAIEAARDMLSAAGATPDQLLLLDSVTFLAGVHPYGAPEYTDAVHARVLEALQDPLCVGVGEIGLDYHFDAEDNIEAAPHDVQIACMERQLAVAHERGLPVELHLRHEADDSERTSHRDALQVLKRSGVPQAGCVLHCFGEDRATMEQFADLGCYIAFGGAATFKRNDGVREAFAACPLDLLLLETDCPYMAPEPVRGLECEPAMITFTAEALIHDRAERTGEDPCAISQAIWNNSIRLFGGRS